MKEDNFLVLCETSRLLARSKNIEYKESILKTRRALFRFLFDNNLLIDLNPFDEVGELNINIAVRRENLTDNGLELFKKRTVDRWLNYLDRSTAPNKYENISRLEKGLKNIRETSSWPPKAVKATGAR